MSRSADDVRVRGVSAPGAARAAGRTARVALLIGCIGVSPTLAQGVPTRPAPELTPPVEAALLRLQEGWLQWTGALYGGDAERARAVVEDLLATSGRLGMRRLPDLAAGALIQAVESGREGEFERAELALEAAELLDPGRAETAFAAADLARLDGAWLSVLVQEARGYTRLPWMGLEGRLALHGLFLWLLASLLLASALFVALEMAVLGPALVRDLGEVLSRRLAALPRPVAIVAVVGLLVWPLAFPSGVLWLLLYWSLLLWGYLGASGRVAIVCGWFLVAAVPVLVEAARERVALDLSPPVRAMESAARGSLYGGLFTDLGVLPAVLPAEPAVEHFLADLHVRLGQWDEARRGYERVLEEEPENLPALVNLGAYYFNRDDHGNAVALFRQAAALAEEGTAVGAAAYFDLSLAYAESYLFDEHREALLEARRIDDLQVSAWMRRPERQRIVTVEGGMARVGEIERALREAWRAPLEVSSRLEALRRARPAILVFLLALLGIAAHGVMRGSRRGAGDAAAQRSGSGRWLPAFVPGLPSAAEGRGLRAYGALLVVAAPLVALAAARGGLGYPLPWRYDPGTWLLSGLAGLVLALVLAVRLLRVARSG